MNAQPRRLTRIEAADIRVAHALVPVHDHPLGRLAGRLGDLGDQPPMIGLCAATAAVGIWRGDRRRVVAGVRMLAALALATGLKNLVKRRIDRTRPALMFEQDRYEVRPGTDCGKAEKSFPSGHTAGMIAIAAAASRSYPEQRGLPFVPAAMFSALLVPRRSHFVSDVVAGAAIGLVAEALIASIWPVRRRRDWNETRP